MFDAQSKETLEWPGVLKEIQKRASSTIGRELCLEMNLAVDFSEALILQKETEEMIGLLETEGTFSPGGIRDIRQALEILAKKGMLPGEVFLDISSTLRASRKLKKFITTKLSPESLLYQKIFPAYTNSDFEDQVERSFSSDGNVLDTASNRLSHIRSSIRTIQQNIREKLLKIIQDPKNKNIVQENLITQRGGRYVIPVKTESQGHIRGIVQDQSLSGSTVYLEPFTVVEDNNKLVMRFSEEKQEIENILRELGEKITPDLSLILQMLDILAEFDVIRAKGDYCLAIGAKKPHLNDQGIIDLHKVKHPLLISGKGSDSVVPVDIRLGKNFDTLIITGSNTGGKTVTLKTLGLCALMVRFGLYLPTRSESDMAFFENILADIGDEQSLEQNLSTFSGHLTNIVYILQQVNEKSLVLFDEIGTGTDPSEGAALARSIIESLREKKARIVVTTHYGELKLLAYEQSGIVNASVEFNLETLSPTYRLLIGIPGKSNALHIASRLGLPAEIINRAQRLLNSEEKEITNSIEKMENEYILLEDEREKQVVVSRQLEQQKEKYENKLKEIEDSKKKIKENLYGKFSAEMNDALEQVKNIVKELQRDKNSQKAETARRSLENLSQRVKNKYQTQAQPPKAEMEIIPGEYYYLERLRQLVEVLELKDDKVYVQAGSLKLTVDKKDLSKVESKELKQKVRNLKNIVPTTKVNRSKGKSGESYRNSFNEIDLRGEFVAEGLELAERFVDESILNNISPVYLIHGVGTGALKQAIREFLGSSHHISSFRPGENNEGGDGVTVVYFKN